MICAMIKVLDDGVGNVTGALKRVGMLDETVVVFSSDKCATTSLLCCMQLSRCCMIVHYMIVLP